MKYFYVLYGRKKMYFECLFVNIFTRHSDRETFCLLAKKKSRKYLSLLFSPAFPKNFLDIKRTELELLKIIKKE